MAAAQRQPHPRIGSRPVDPLLLDFRARGRPAGFLAAAWKLCCSRAGLSKPNIALPITDLKLSRSLWRPFPSVKTFIRSCKPFGLN
jgi:hypothetical protein